MKIDIVLKFDVKVVGHSEVVQNTSTAANNLYCKTAFFSIFLDFK